MTGNAEKAKQQVLQLTEADRAQLARLLIESLDDCADSAVEADWDAELQRRAEQVTQGSARLGPAHETLAEIRDKYR